MYRTQSLPNKKFRIVKLYRSHNLRRGSTSNFNFIAFFLFVISSEGTNIK